MGRVDGKVAFITGGSMGMGEQHALLLAKEGAKVIVTDVANDQGETVVETIVKDGGDALYLDLDVSDEKGWKAAVSEGVNAYGKIDILVNNAGILIQKAVHETETGEWDRLFDVNVKGVFFGTKYILPAMQKAGKGSIVNISSIYGLVGGPSAAAYEASKGAIRLLTKATAVDYAPFNIRVNSIHPGVIKTPMTAPHLATEEMAKQLLGATLMQRAAEPIEVSQAVLFLASDEASFITGAELVVDGGYTAV